MDLDEIPKYPEIKQEEFFELDEKETLAGFKEAEHGLIMYTGKNGQLVVGFKKLDDNFLAAAVVELSQNTPWHKKIWTYLKSMLECVRVIKLPNKKKGHELAVRTINTYEWFYNNT